MIEHTGTWQEAILANFIPKREQMLLVVDPDNLMRDDVLLADIQKRNYDVLEMADEVAFRDAFERAYRSRWDAGEALHVVVVVHTRDGRRHIPYDLWKKSKRIELGVSRLFPNLNAIVVSQLDNAYYADLYPAHQQLVAQHTMLRLERETIEFILRAVFDLDPVGACNPARWVEFLIHKHYSGRNIPDALEEYIATRLLPQVAESGIRAEFLGDQAAFYEWLSEEWARFIAGGMRDAADVDLTDMRLRPLLAHLFAEGLLARMPVPDQAFHGERDWTSIGLQYQNERHASKPIGEDERRRALYALRGRLERFVAMDEATLPSGKTDVRDWLNLATQWAEAIYQANTLPPPEYEEIQPDLSRARLSLDAHFWEFVQARYSAAPHYQDNSGPISVAAVNRWFDEHIAAKERLALICFDGLALDQWFLLREYLRGALQNPAFRENRTYAIAPTLTPFSRQALFSGQSPQNFATTVWSSDKDAAHWQAWWVNHGIPRKRVSHVAVGSGGKGLEAFHVTISGKNLRLGVLVNLFDDVMHAVKGMTAQADKRIYYAALRGHLENGCVGQLFGELLDSGYRVFVTADHGNIAGVGIGETPPKALVETYARRVAVFDSEALARDYAEARALRYFRTKALPPDVHPVYLPASDMFANSGATMISHGGMSVEELVVPFIEVIHGNH